jgi:hypothetical protein
LGYLINLKLGQGLNINDILIQLMDFFKNDSHFLEGCVSLIQSLMVEFTETCSKE